MSARGSAPPVRLQQFPTTGSNWTQSRRAGSPLRVLPIAIPAVVCGLFLAAQLVAWRRAPAQDGSLADDAGISRLRSELSEEARMLVKEQSEAAQAALHGELAKLSGEVSELRSQLGVGRVVDPRSARGQMVRAPQKPTGPTLIVGGHPITRGVHYDADYDLMHLKPMPPTYAYPPRPAFKYIHDVLAPGRGPAFVIVSHQPMVYYFPQLITPAEADAIIAEATPRLSRSQVGDGNNAKESDERTSQGCWLDDGVPAAKVLRDRIVQVTGWDRRYMEMTQILRYTKTQHYNQHHDFVDPVVFGDQGPINEERALTFFTWLEDMPEGGGGETVLPMANGAPPAPRFGLTCGRGLRVFPRKGAAIAFYGMRPDKTLDEYSLHGGCPVKKGVKWVSPQWMRVPGRWARELGYASADMDEQRMAMALQMPQGKLSHGIKPGDIVEGKHYVADYDIFHPRPAPPDYDYGPSPVFKYIPDVPNYPADIPWILVSHQPKVFYFPRLITHEEADAIIVEASKRLSRSTVGDAGQAKVSDERTSEGCWMDDRVPAVRVLRDRIQAVSGWKRSDFEMTQVLRYKHAQRYNQHVDYIDPNLFGDQPIPRQRAATFFTWLEDMAPEDGGETVLPMANSGPPAPGYGLTCDRGLRVRPRKGAAILFYDQKPDLTLDPYSLHGACPVVRGTKWVVPQWLWTSGLWDKAHGFRSAPRW
eukprot:TRINITY_DN17914_c0_g1_i1.p1 TRINITY_DN17914_c0_g1~~TRINITY_DN17914_c0_g1_i1.p1  ORF type:complete len:732 (+),score=183.54 TRINITY_DN17914_c0_g1_i1:89-2197(+)